MKIRDSAEIGGNVLMYFLTSMQTKEVFEIISLVLSIVISVIIIVGKLITWFKNAKEDGKISKEEMEDGINIIKDGAEEIKDKIDKEK